MWLRPGSDPGFHLLLHTLLRLSFQVLLQWRPPPHHAAAAAMCRRRLRLTQIAPGSRYWPTWHSRNSGGGGAARRRRYELATNVQWDEESVPLQSFSKTTVNAGYIERRRREDRIFWQLTNSGSAQCMVAALSSSRPSKHCIDRAGGGSGGGKLACFASLCCCRCPAAATWSARLASAAEQRRRSRHAKHSRFRHLILDRVISSLKVRHSPLGSRRQGLLTQSVFCTTVVSIVFLLYVC